jgi:hypothetical protein
MNQCQHTHFINHTLKDLKAYIKTVVVGDFNTPLSSIDRSSTQKINKEILDLKYTVSNGPSQCLQNISSNSTSIHFSQQLTEHSPKQIIS